MEATDRFIPCPTCDGRGEIEVLAADTCATHKHCRHIRVYNIPGHVCCYCGTYNLIRKAEEAAIGREWATDNALENGN